jgi:hypothetical protein
MGLNAVVYSNGAAGVQGAGRDPQVLIERRLGNATCIAEVSHVVELTLGEQSLLRCKVLYSASHAGDYLSAKEIPQLERELDILTRSVPSPVIAGFVSAMRDLVEIAKRENTSIWFV